MSALESAISGSSTTSGDGPASEAEALQRLQDEIESLGVEEPAATRPSLDLDLSCGAKGTGPRLFCGHVPKEVNDEMVRQHFSRWGTVSDVYFPCHKKTLKRRPFCFVTFANKEDAVRALAESGLEIAGVAIKNLTMVEDRDKYYTNKHVSARQALLQALKQLGPGGASSAAAPPPALAPQQNGDMMAQAAAGGISRDQLSNLAAIMALEGVPTEVVLQTLGVPGGPAPHHGDGLQPGPSSLGVLDAALLQALASPSLSSQSTYDHLARGSFDLRQSMDLRTSLDLATAMSARTSLDLSSLQQNLAAASQGLGGYDAGTRMRAADSHSTLASSADAWSAAPSARTSLDAALLPVTAGFLSSAAPALQTRLSLDAALQLHHAQQALLASQAHAGYGGMPPLPPGGPQQNISSVMHSGFYQPAAAPQQQPEAVQHDISTVMSSGFYGGGARPPVPPVRHSMHEFSSSGYGRSTASLPFADNGWGAPAPAPPAPAGTLGGYSTVLRPSFDRSGLPPLAPRSPNQDLPRDSASGSPDSLRLLANNGWPLPGQRLAV
ncbi:Heterogeneous nuclear ribonucleo A1-like 2 [Micractinium conductrix]|uniref:Heterogeneous nuclear ribonucleo A1-like 2 n=1 Tax=Micractinium conductrix TaxID=554055 RepID=A0A2P6VHS3_9CHLO|nr:Heterogeneous nuclear ribonucleo A1-like 2 [Micractinium conductrix]|eukprot:PSC73646.1 Heterogeneous nuclear ribonucleo A1-like 2 [Micractinium conductrix]